MSDKEQIEACYRQMYRGMVGKDRGLLSVVLDDTFVLIHMTGMRQNKETFIRAVGNGTLNYSKRYKQLHLKKQGKRLYFLAGRRGSSPWLQESIRQIQPGCLLKDSR